MRILNDNAVIMVDDSEADRHVARRCYTRSRLVNPWREFADGAAFIAHLQLVKAGEEDMPALVLLDINMPLMSGFEVLELIRADPDFDELPVFLMLTNSDNPRDLERARAHGASGLTTKPDNIAEYVTFFDSLA